MKLKRALVVFSFLISILSVSALRISRHADDEDEGHRVAAHDQSNPDSNSISMPSPMTHDEHSHGRHNAPLLELNETEILQGHAPDPLSYWSHDYELSKDQDFNNWRSLMILHVLGSSTALFVLLPIAISLRSAKHPWHPAVALSYLLTLLFSSTTGSLYKKLTGNLYNGSTHGSTGYLILVLASGLAMIDTLAFIRRAFFFFKGSHPKTLGEFWSSVILNKFPASEPEYTSLAHEELTEYYELDQERVEASHNHRRSSSSESLSNEHRQWHHSNASQGTFVNATPTASTHRHAKHVSLISTFSDDTLHLPVQRLPTNSQDGFESLPLKYRIGWILLATAERLLVILGFVQLISGVTVYSGICRGNYRNGCLAHLIKGSIFWMYGLLSFGRYLGAWGDMGWAWNRLPARRAYKTVSAEFVESSVIFVYGITNVWMERLGAAPGSPYTTKEIQHISIAAMFWFAGILGLALEVSSIRNWLSARSLSVVKTEERITPPPSYAGSFNPFPALVIGVTGAAMSAHHQTYLFQVEIHALWGFFLTGFAVLRCLTYFFLWLRPPHSILPSRPPTEALASFFLACGGLTFILSTEQITFAAMRRGMDDLMLIFNVVVTLTCVAFCWVLAVVGFKGFLHHRARMSPSRHTTHKVLFDDNGS